MTLWDRLVTALAVVMAFACWGLLVYIVVKA